VLLAGSGPLPVWVGRMAPVVCIAVTFAGVVGRTQHGKVRHLQDEIRTGFAAVKVIQAEVLARRELVLVAAA
jgi:hypothetical protein